MQSVVFVQDGRYVKQYLCQIFYRKYLEFFLKFFVVYLYLVNLLFVIMRLNILKECMIIFVWDLLCFLLGNIMLEFVSFICIKYEMFFGDS